MFLLLFQSIVLFKKNISIFSIIAVIYRKQKFLNTFCIKESNGKHTIGTTNIAVTLRVGDQIDAGHIAQGVETGA